MAMLTLTPSTPGGHDQKKSQPYVMEMGAALGGVAHKRYPLVITTFTKNRKNNWHLLKQDV